MGQIKSFALTAVVTLTILTRFALAQNESSSEDDLRQLDLQVTSAQISKIQLLRDHLNSHPDSSSDAEFKFKIIEAMSQLSTSQFRLIHSSTTTNEINRRTQDYQSTLDLILLESASFQKSYKNYRELDQILAYRAKAFSELKKNKEAIETLAKLIKTYPRSDLYLSSNIKLYELLVSEKRYNEALNTVLSLEVLTRSTESESIILHHIGFGYYYLDQTNQAIKYLEKELSLTRNQGTKKNPLITVESDQLEQQLLNNIVLFYFHGISKKTPGFNIDAAIPYFVSLKSGSHIQSMVKQLMNLLRSNGNEGLIYQFSKNITLNPIIKSEIQQEIINKLIIRSLEKRDFQSLYFNISLIRSRLDYKKKENEKNSITEEIASTLVGIFRQIRQGKLKNFTGYTPEKGENLHNQCIELIKIDPSGRKVLATIYMKQGEDAFQRNRLNEAAKFYTKSEEYLDATPQFQTLKSQLRAQILQTKYLLIPGKGSDRTASKSKEHPVVSDLLKNQVNLWIKDFEGSKSNLTPADHEHFALVICDLLLRIGDRENYQKQLKELIKTYPKTQAAALAEARLIEFLTNEGKWEDVIVESHQAQPNFSTQNITIVNQIKQLLDDAYFEKFRSQVKSANQDLLLSLAINYLKDSMPSHVHAAELVGLGLKEALAHKDTESSQKWREILGHYSLGSPIQVALIDSKLAEDRFELDTALEKLKEIVKIQFKSRELPNETYRGVKERLLKFSWIFGLSKLSQEVLNDSHFCDHSFHQTCEHYRAWLNFNRPQPFNAKELTQALQLVRTASPNVRPLWATLVLENSASVGLKANDQALRAIIANWESVDHLSQFSILKRLFSVLPGALQSIRSQIRNSAQLQLNPAQIKARVQLIKTYESLSTSLEILGWSYLKAAGLQFRSQIFRDFSDDILAIPYSKKLGQMSHEDYIKSLHSIADPFLKTAFETEKQAQALSVRAKVSAVSPKTPMILSDPRWLILLKSAQGVEQKLAQALQKSQWNHAFYLLQMITVRKIWTEDEIQFARALILSRIGAHPESIQTLSQLNKNAPENLRSIAKAALIQYYFLTRQPEQLHEALKMNAPPATLENGQLQQLKEAAQR